MQDHITPQRVANSIMMLRNQKNYSLITFLIVEGETDAKVFQNLVDAEKCRIEIATDKDKAISALEILENRKVKGVLAIVDADYWIVEAIEPKSSNIFLTDTHDLETMLIASPALEKIVCEYLPGSKFEQAKSVSDRIRSLLTQVGQPIGHLRWVNYREKLRLNFQEPPLLAFIDMAILSVDVVKMIKAMKMPKQVLSLTDDEINTKMQEVQSKSANAWHVCQGHDLVLALEFVIVFAVREFFGREQSEKVQKRVNPAKLDESLRLAYERAFFQSTILYSKPVFDRQIVTSCNLPSVMPGVIFGRSWAAHLNNRAKEHPARQGL